MIKKKFAISLLLVGSGLLNTACVSTAEQQVVDGKILVAPLVPSQKLEITLAKLDQILSSMELKDEQRARFHYDRGVIYDRFGLTTLSRIDFHQALKLDPKIADVYNYLGIYDTQAGEYERAYEAFDAVLELAPDYSYGYLNRGIALYYGERYQLAVQDLEQFYLLAPEDGYRALWLYFAEEKLSPAEASLRLQFNRTKLKANQWPTDLVDYSLGHLTAGELIALAKQDLEYPEQYAERLCEAYFYMAKQVQQQGQISQAETYYRLALATNIYDYVEHRYASLELKQLLNEQSQSASTALNTEIKQ
ncbi:lipoprotein NlpI [Shewanella marina]|uniref:lipoprotein NlpI n=1 Tax=Shewanella marina TaxID=487319 RepID=UPI0004701BB0|nr:lipoprotein NlpI [Shewanella marina]